jgi:hypothetical protein
MAALKTRALQTMARSRSPGGREASGVRPSYRRSQSVVDRTEICGPIASCLWGKAGFHRDIPKLSVAF